MRIFAFFRTGDLETSKYVGLLAAHGFGALGEPVTYFRILDDNEEAIALEEGMMHQAFQGIETTIAPFATYDALCTELARLSNTGRHVIVDLPSRAKDIPEIRHVSDCCIVSVASLQTPSSSRRISPLDSEARLEKESPARSCDAPHLWWLLGCAQIGKTSVATTLERACIANAISLHNDSRLAVLPFEVPVMSRAERSSLRAGVPLGSVCRAGTLLAWALMFAAGDVRKTSNTQHLLQKKAVAATRAHSLAASHLLIRSKANRRIRIMLEKSSES